jgi:UMF1 family MFS transporter
MRPTQSPSARATIAAWCFYDWANSPFTTLVVTFIYGTYFTQAIAPDEIVGTALWSRGVTITALVVAILSPMLGAAADRGGLRVRFLLLSTFVCVVTTAALTYVAPGSANAVFLALTLFVIANIAFEMGMVFYNSLLPAIATPEKIGRISGYGWGLGYIGGLAALVVALVGFVQPETPWFGMSREAGFNIRATNLMVAVWFLLFSLPFFLVVREERRPGARTTPGEAIRELRRTFHEVRRFRESAKFLLARLIYNDGLVTIFAFGGIYAAGTFGFSFTEILIFGIVINVAAGLGALSFGFIDDLIGGKNTVMVSVVALGVATGLAAWAPSREWLWVAGIMIGIFAGPNQSASRSLMGRFVPAGRQAEFFGFFAFSGKFTAFLGPLFLGLATQWFDSQRWGVATVLLFFVVGGLLLISVNERAGIAAARSEDFSGA